MDLLACVLFSLSLRYCFILFKKCQYVVFCSNSGQELGRECCIVLGFGEGLLHVMLPLVNKKLFSYKLFILVYCDFTCNPTTLVQ